MPIDMSFAAPASTEEVQSMVKSLSVAAQDYDPSPNGEASRRKLVALAKDLIKQVRNPLDMADVHMANAMELVSIRTCLQLKALHAIPFPGNVTLSEIATATGAAEPLLERLLRMLVCTGFLESPSPHVYSHSKASRAYTLVPGPGMFFQLVYDESFLMIDNLHAYLEQKGLQEPQQQEYSPYAWKSNAEGVDIYDTMARYPQRFAAFQGGLAHADSSIPLLGYYDFEQLNTEDSSRTVMVDIGGGVGHTIVQILDAYPALKNNAAKFVLQDKPAVLKKAAENSHLPENVVRMGHDFWTEQPVKGAKAYFLRRILHDFSDTFATKILGQIVPAMAPDSRILIADLMFPSEHISPDDLSIATFDITMLNMGGKERSEADFRMLLENVGCELVKVWRSEGGFGVIVEGRLKGSGERGVDGPVLSGGEGEGERGEGEAPAAVAVASIQVDPTADPAVDPVVDPTADPAVDSVVDSVVDPVTEENGNTGTVAGSGTGDDFADAAAAAAPAPATATASDAATDKDAVPPADGVSTPPANATTNGHANGLPVNQPADPDTSS